MGEAIDDPDLQDETARAARALARVVEPIHAVAYYTPEINGFRDDGYRGWWHAYMAYRPAPMGAITAPTAIATLYNFAPTMVERAIPGVWDIMSPDRVIERRDELVRAAMGRLFADGALADEVAEAAELARQACADLPVVARPLFASHAASHPGISPPRKSAFKRKIMSARSMNAPGPTTPMPGRFQRASASKPTILSVAVSTRGW